MFNGSVFYLPLLFLNGTILLEIDHRDQFQLNVTLILGCLDTVDKFRLT